MKNKYMLFGHIFLGRGLTEEEKEKIDINLDGITITFDEGDVKLVFGLSELEILENKHNIFSFCLYCLDECESDNLDLLKNSIENRKKVRKATLCGSVSCLNGNMENVLEDESVDLRTVFVLMDEQDFDIKPCKFQKI